MSNTVFSPITLNTLHLKNRTIKSATYEGMNEANAPSRQLIDWHCKIAEGEVAMNTLAYCAVNQAGATFSDQIVMQPDIAPQLKAFTDSIHALGGKVAAQLAHCGFFSGGKRRNGKPVSPSRTFNKLGFSSGKLFSKAMSQDEINQTINDFARSASIAQEAGFDAIEIHSGHGYLLSQFLSPAFNKRKDEYGGALENRLRFPVEVIQAVRKEVGSDFPILVKMNLEDGFKGGLTIKEAIHVATTFEKTGVDALILSGGFTSVNAFYLLRGEVPLKEMIRLEKNWITKIALSLFGPFVISRSPFKRTFFLEQAKMIREKVKIPLAYVGGITSLEDMEKVLSEGFDLIALGRPLVHDASFVRKLRTGSITKTGCNYCNQCVAQIGHNGVKCVLNY